MLEADFFLPLDFLVEDFLEAFDFLALEFFVFLADSLSFFFNFFDFLSSTWLPPPVPELSA
jgi:hypothetical protein